MLYHKRCTLERRQAPNMSCRFLYSCHPDLHLRYSYAIVYQPLAGFELRAY